MKVVTIGTEKRIFNEGSAAEARVISYGSVVDELHIVCFTGKGFSEKQLSSNVYAYPTNSSNKLFWILDTLSLRKKFDSKKIDLVSAQDPFESGMAAFFLAKMLKAKFHLQIHTDFLSPYFKKDSLLNYVRVRIARFLLPRADGVRVVSERIKNSLDTADIRLKNEVVVLPIYVQNISEENKESIEQGFLQKKYKAFNNFILIVSRLEKEKNVSLGIFVFSKVQALFRNTALVIVGDGSLKEDLKKETGLLGISDRVFFEGWQQNLADYYRSATLFLSTSSYEGYGMSIVEASFFGLPIVTSDVGIIGNMYKREWAYVFNVGDEKGLERVLKEALGNLEGARKKAEIAKINMQKIPVSYERYLELYKMAWQKCL